jgi:16S rRNA (guanine527-N7)-methyltransferase
MDLPPRALEALRLFTLLLEERALPGGMVARSDGRRLWERHVLDSLRAASAFRAGDRLAYDLGSGAGLPGIPLAIALPGCEFVLMESRRPRVAFLELASQELELGNVDVRAGRVEDQAGGADVCTARAFGPLDRSWEAAHGLLRRGGRLLYFAGAGLEDPRGAGEALLVPERPASVELWDGLASRSPLVIIARR